MIATNGERQAPASIKEAEPTHLTRYQFALRYISKNHAVLDAPCGSGYGAALLASESDCVYGVDISQEAIRHSREFFQRGNTAFYSENIENLKALFPQSNFFDAIVSFEGIEHLHYPNSFLGESRRLLKHGGSLIISTPRKPHGSPYHAREYSLEEFRDLLLPYFAIRNIFGQIYTDIFDLNQRKANPYDYKKFNFIAHCILE